MLPQSLRLRDALGGALGAPRPLWQEVRAQFHLGHEENGPAPASWTEGRVATSQGDAPRKMIKSEYIMKDGNGNYFLNDTLVKLDLMNF